MRQSRRSGTSEDVAFSSLKHSPEWIADGTTLNALLKWWGLTVASPAAQRFSVNTKHLCGKFGRKRCVRRKFVDLIAGQHFFRD